MYKKKWSTIEITHIIDTGHYQFHEYHVYDVLQEEVQNSNVMYSGYWNWKNGIGHGELIQPYINVKYIGEYKCFIMNISLLNYC